MLLELFVRFQPDVHIVDEEEFVREEEIRDDDFHDSLELLDRHPMNVADLHNLRDECLVEGQGSCRHDETTDNLIDNVPHARKIEAFDRHLYGILDSHTNREFIHIIVLNSNHQIQAQLIGHVSILL